MSRKCRRTRHAEERIKARTKWNETEIVCHINGARRYGITWKDLPEGTEERWFLLERSANAWVCFYEGMVYVFNKAKSVLITLFFPEPKNLAFPPRKCEV